MGDRVVSERPGEDTGAAQDAAGIPGMPVLSQGEQFPDVLYRLLSVFRSTIGWQFRPPDKGGPVFVILRRAGLGPLKIVESFPLTEDGWTSAWQSLVRQNPGIARRVRAALRAREDEAEKRHVAAEGPLHYDDQGITIAGLIRSHRIGWPEVRRFADGSAWGGGQQGRWGLAVVLDNGRTFIVPGPMSATDGPSEMLVAVGQAAMRYGIPADLTGTIDRGSFPATLLGASGVITVTLRHERLADEGRDPILEVIQLTEPAQPGDTLALSNGTEVGVLGIRQLFADGRWEQVAYVYVL